MKRIGAILSLSILITLLMASTCSAAVFELTEIFPEDGYKSFQPAGVAIKMKFSQDVSAEKIHKDNEKCMSIVDSKNKKVPFTVFYSEKRPKDVLVVVDKNLEPKASYKFTLSGDFQSSSGSLLDEGKVVNFKIRDTARDANINMALMGVMVVGMIFFTTRTAKKEMQKAEKQNAIEGKANPYKIAKETGKPVADVIAQLEKEKEKAAKKKNKQSGRSTGNLADDENDEDGYINPNLYKVKAPKPISSGGSTYITGRKAMAEQIKAETKAKSAMKNTNPKNATGKTKNKKK